MEDETSAIEIPRSLGWLVFVLGIVVGSWMWISCVLAVVRDAAHPNLGWGTLGLLWLQVPAFTLAVAGAIGIEIGGRDPRTLALRLLGIAYVAVPFLALAWNNGGC